MLMKLNLRGGIQFCGKDCLSHSNRITDGDRGRVRGDDKRRERGIFILIREWMRENSSQRGNDGVETPSVNFINILQAAFMPVDPKSVKRYWQLDWILTLLGATRVKVVHKYVGEIEP